MSAYILNDENLDAILTACQLHNLYSHGKDLSAIGQALKDQNFRSVNCRYNENETPSPYQFKGLTKLYSIVQLLKICDCYEYQSCETKDYQETDACKIINYIRKNLIKLIPGYDGAKWGL